MMLQNILKRSFFTGLIKPRYSIAKSDLAKLRRKTGYSISNCKKALELNQNELQKAEKWLHQEAQKQGWAKAMKLQGRAANQGLVGIHLSKHSAALVEVGCETDFVARNDHFKELVQTVAASCWKNLANKPQVDQLIKMDVSSEDLANLTFNDKKLSDRVALSIAQLGENIVLKRGTVWMATNDIHIEGAVHPATLKKETMIGTYAGLVALKKTKQVKDLTSVGYQICMQIIGMNPKMLEAPEMEEEIIPVVPNKEASPIKEEQTLEREEKKSQLENQNDDDEEEEEEKEEEKEQPALLQQKFLFNPDLKVTEFLDDHHLTVLDFLRYEMGETKLDDNK